MTAVAEMRDAATTLAEADTMDPSVAGALADWLDHTADVIDAYRGSVAHVGCAFQALVTARAINGGGS